MDLKQCATIASALVVCAVFSSPVAAHAELSRVSLDSSDSIEVCQGNSLSTSDANGQQISGRELDLSLRQVQNLCNAGVGSVITFEQYADAVDSGLSLTGEYANVVAQINNQPSKMGISAYANSIPLDGRRKELSCIYRMQPTDGPATSWEACGTAETSASSYLTTRGNDFCPVPGSRWEAVADLYVDDRLTQSDTAVAVAV